MKFKWYDWDGVGEIPIGVLSVRYRNGDELGASNNLICDAWTQYDRHDDIIAYTLGEELEVDNGNQDLHKLFGRLH